jgi:hypothetical protein
MARVGGKNAAFARVHDAGESDDALDVFSVQNVDRVFG